MWRSEQRIPELVVDVIAERMGLDEDEVRVLQYVSGIYDVGMVGVEEEDVV